MEPMEHFNRWRQTAHVDWECIDNEGYDEEKEEEGVKGQ